MALPSITQGQIAIDPANGIFYYKDASNTLVSTSLAWLQASDTQITTGDSVTVAGSLVITGDLTVNGNTVSVNVSSVTVEDNILVLNSNVTEAPTLNAGLEIERGTSTNVSIRWNESTDKWEYTNDGTTYYVINENSNTANSWTTARTISLSGDVSGSTSIDGSANVTISTTVANDSHNHTASTLTFGLNDASDVTLADVASGDFLRYNGASWINDPVNLATDTIGNYVQSLVAGNDITISNNSGEAATPTISLTSNSITVGSTSIALGASSTTIAGLTSVGSTSFSGELTGNVTGNADTATKWQTQRTITLDGDVSGSVSIDGSNNVTITTTVADNSHGHGPTTVLLALGNLTNVTISDPVSGDFLRYNGSDWFNDPVNLGVDTTGSYVESLTAGSNILITNNLGEGTTPTISVSSTPNYDTITANTLTVDSIEIDPTGALTGQVLKYDGTKFIPSQDNVAAAGNLSLTDLTDIAFVNPVDGSLLRYDGSNWTDSGIAFEDISDYGNSSTPQYGDVIYHNGSNWTNKALELDDITDIDLSAKLNGHVLQYNGSEWVSSSIEINEINNFNVAATPNTGHVLQWNGTTWSNSDITLGAETSGDYLAALTEGENIIITGASGEGANPTIAVNTSLSNISTINGTSITINANTTTNGYVLIENGLTVSGVSATPAFAVTGNASISQDIYLGQDAANFASSLTYPTLTVQSNHDNYSQIAFRNLGNSASSSTDIIAYANNGDDSAGWIDMGITSDSFNDLAFTTTGPNDGYIFMEAPVGTTGNGDLIIATGGNGQRNAIIFAAGGLQNDNTQVTIFPDVNVHVEIPTPSISPSTGAFTVVGGVGIQGDMNIEGNVSVQGTITFGGAGTTVETENLTVTDPFVFVSNGNTGDIVDSGIITEYKNNDATPQTRYSGIIRDASDGTYKLFADATTRPSSTVNFSEAGLIYGSLRANNITSTTINSGNITLNSNSSITIGVTEVLTATNYTGTAAYVVNGVYTTDTETVTPTMLAVGPARAGFRSEINAQTGTTYTLTLNDLAKLVTMDNADPMTLTVPLNSSVQYQVGDKIDVLRKGAGTLIIAGEAGVTVNATPGLKLRAQWSSATLVKLATDSWVLIGDLSA
jgi:hypothetical protein